VHCNFSPPEKARVNGSALLVALKIKLLYFLLGGMSRSSQHIYCGSGHRSMILTSNSLRKREIFGGVPAKFQICVLLLVGYRYPSPAGVLSELEVRTTERLALAALF
jgi:hypothetical protein